MDVAAADEAVRQIAQLAKKTHSALPAQNASLLGGIGGFAALIQLPPDKPFFAAATDGVGSKLELAKAHNCPEVIGRDVVAMCVNDLLCAGVRPLFFLDYIACDKLRPAFIAAIVRGIAAACEESGCALVGGETAEMPGTYASGKFDVAGFAGGVADGEELLRAENISAGDALIAIASNGAHSNGYALIHRLLREQTKLAEKEINGENVVTALLRPTRLYCRPIEHLRRAVRVRGLAHITGGGVDGNLPRIFPPGLHAEYKMPPLPRCFSYYRMPESWTTKRCIKYSIAASAWLSSWWMRMRTPPSRRCKMPAKPLGGLELCWDEHCSASRCFNFRTRQ